MVILLKKVTILNLSSAIFLSMLLFKKDSSKHTPSLDGELKDSFGEIKLKWNFGDNVDLGHSFTSPGGVETLEQTDVSSSRN